MEKFYRRCNGWTEKCTLVAETCCWSTPEKLLQWLRRYPTMENKHYEGCTLFNTKETYLLSRFITLMLESQREKEKENGNIKV